MKISFQTGRTYRANIIERGDKHDQSVVHLLSTLPGEAFLVEKKGGSWIVTAGLISPVVINEVKAETPITVDSPVAVGRAVIAKKKSKQPKKKKR